MGMSNGSPPASPAPGFNWFENDPHAHVVQFYTADAFLLDSLSRLIGAGLESGGAAVFIATNEHRTGLAQRLAARGLEVAKLREQGQYEPLDAAETLAAFMLDGWPEAIRFSGLMGDVIERAKSHAKAPDAGIIVFGEITAMLCAQGKVNAAVHLEKLWNDLAREHRFSLRCAFPIETFSRRGDCDLFLKISAAHSGVIPGEGYTSLASETDRLREIARLEQKAQVLDAERALHQSEERFRLLVESAQDYAMFMMDLEGHITSWNLGAERIKGYKASEIIGKHFSCFYPEEDQRAGTPQRILELARREGRFEVKGWRVRKDGSRFLAHAIITALRDDTGRLCGFGKVTRDITEQMQAHAALEKSNGDLTNEIAERVAAERQLHESQKSLQQLSGQLLRLQDEERRRLALELHDGAAQLITALSLNLALVSHSAELLDERAQGALAECASLAEQCSSEIRTLSYLMHPPALDGQGLGPAIKWFSQGFARRSGIATEVEITTTPGRLSPDAEIALFRIVQESLTNVHRHAGSPSALVHLTQRQGEIILEIRDSGRGLPPELLQDLETAPSALGVGICGMRERLRQFGGRLEIESSAGLGSCVRAVLPLSASAPALAAGSSRPHGKPSRDGADSGQAAQ
ncbi:MAG: PAS domain S-box protein [Terriglobia bacterium]